MFIHMCTYVHTLTGVHKRRVGVCEHLSVYVHTLLCIHMYTFAVDMIVYQSVCECVCPQYVSRHVTDSDDFLSTYLQEAML